MEDISLNLSPSHLVVYIGDISYMNKAPFDSQIAWRHCVLKLDTRVILFQWERGSR